MKPTENPNTNPKFLAALRMEISAGSNDGITTLMVYNIIEVVSQIGIVGRPHVPFLPEVSSCNPAAAVGASWGTRGPQTL
ncbi:uncharacterized protein N7500_004267 [Penicillium coprophilum]|uniref:uncharacterized protein n=1 Tax=Penicillium coprophilum TaxID=36646 RepID=UPI00238C3F40|nr:uncharacterized protein N7500_004267 [Penicillium coprophilum]KAJ5171484.1 hypothetical protein N7500_004267 [Penicillium coprophilum]